MSADLPAVVSAPAVVADPRFERSFRVTVAHGDTLALVEIRASRTGGAARLLALDLRTADVLAEHRVVGLDPRAAAVEPLAGPGAHAWVRSGRARVRLRGPDAADPRYHLDANLPAIALALTLDVRAVPTPIATLTHPDRAGALPRYRQTVNLAPTAGHLRVRGVHVPLDAGRGCLEFACGDLAGDPAPRALALAAHADVGFLLVGARGPHDTDASAASVYWTGRVARPAGDLTLSPPDLDGGRRAVSTRDGAVIGNFAARAERGPLLVGLFSGRFRDDGPGATTFSCLPGLVDRPATPWKRGRLALVSTPPDR